MIFFSQFIQTEVSHKCKARFGCKNVTHLCSPSNTLQLIGAFKCGTVQSKISSGIRNTRGQTLGFLSLLDDIGLL